MDISTSLQITPKGEDEIKRRVYKLGMKKRSLLLLLERPQSIQYLLARSLFPSAEIMEEIRALIANQFVAVSAPGPLTATASAPTAGGSPVDSRVELANGIIISEGKFLLIDFCVDNFGTRSQDFVAEISAAGDEKNLALCLAKVFVAAQKHCPDKIPALLAAVREINDTA